MVEPGGNACPIASEGFTMVRTLPVCASIITTAPSRVPSASVAASCKRASISSSLAGSELSVKFIDSNFGGEFPIERTATQIESAINRCMTGEDGFRMKLRLPIVYSGLLLSATEDRSVPPAVAGGTRDFGFWISDFGLIRGLLSFNPKSEIQNPKLNWRFNAPIVTSQPISTKTRASTIRATKNAISVEAFCAG